MTATNGQPPPPAWHAFTAGQTAERFGVAADRGLAADEVTRRREEHGPNRLRKTETRRWWRILLDQAASIIVYLLGAAAILAFATGRWPEGLAVTAVILVNTAIGFVSEWQAVRSMAALRRMGEHQARVRRAGDEREIPAPDIVPGDVVLVTAGDLVPADLRLIEAEHLRVSEAALTGESVPADKTVDPVAGDTALAERRSMLYKGTTVSDGRAAGVAVATGPGTELGRIAALAEEADATASPLQRRLDDLGGRLAWITIGVGVVVALVGFLLRRDEVTLVVETALALGIAAIPEGLPIVATIALARGMYLLARRHALVNRLTAVETLGATRVIFTDKTGTLTENRMRLQVVVTPAGEWRADGDGNGPGGADSPGGNLVRRTIEAAVLCTTASPDRPAAEGDPGGDPTEVALLEGGRAVGIARDALVEETPRIRIEEFDPRRMMMATFHETADGVRVAVKGAPGAVLDVCTGMAGGPGADAARLDEARRREWRGTADALAGEGLRLLAVAEKHVRSADADPYAELRFLGLVGLHDPPREGVREAIDTCQAAGIRVEMVTGDQPETARAIARAVGITGDADDPETLVLLGSELDDPDRLDDAARDRIHRANIFARVTPEQKLNLVRIHQDEGEIVAMTGDGVNDAPALKQADIGVAMGRRGTEAARQVADIVLEDDAFETIVAAVEQGRVIFGNIRMSVMFMLCTNVAEVIAVALATFAGWTLPLLPLQILFLNMVTDVLPALALGVGPGSGTEMRTPPRAPGESVLTRRHWLGVAGWAAIIAACVLGTLLIAEGPLGLPPLEAVTLSFLTLAFGKLWFTFVLRGPRSGVFRNEVTRNPWVWGAIGVCIGLLAATVYVPWLADLLQTRRPGLDGWLLLSGMSLVPLVIGQVVRAIQRHRGHDEERQPRAAS